MEKKVENYMGTRVIPGLYRDIERDGKEIASYYYSI